uniref:Fibulin-1 n=1 Tax=Esox lucius TaxID=8010 RepID=A0A6Q2YHZ5_ESOLU
MEPWMLWVFSLYGVLHGQDHPASPKVEDCCYDGRHRALGGEDCTVLPLIASSHICRIAQEQCCSAAAGNTLCTTGINLAKEQGACVVPFTQEDPFETKTTKMCCDCCLLGLMSASRGYGCELALDMGKRCRETAQACCGGVQPGHNNTVAGTLGNLMLPKWAPPNWVCSVGSTKCSHLCVGKDTCACFDGYHLQPDQHTCEDINECLNGSHNCGAGQSCINTEGSYRCQRDTNCGTGYELTDANICLDIDECALGTHNCGGDFECRNREGSFRCLPRVPCGEGYIQDAVGTCIDINECLTQSSPCQPGQTCINTVGSYNCRRYSVICGHGYHLSGDGSHCVDVNECLLEEACQGHDCVNLLGSFRCECRPGFTFHSVIRLCEDINECRHYSGRLCAHKCDNTPGSYQCSCTTGFKLASDGRNCEDVNECENNPCSQECANVYGSYQCYCRRGYHLSDVDGINCEDIDECALPTGGHVCSYRCSNTPGSFHCTCPLMGYTLAPNGRTCQDMDECATGSHSCKAAEVCVNIQGGFRCLSFECPPNYRRAAEGRCERIPCEFTRGPSCLSLPLEISFYNITFPTNVPVPADVFRMGPSNSVQGDSVRLDIVSGDPGGFFTAKRQAHGGVISLRSAVSEPRDFLLTVEMRLSRYGTAHHYVAKIAVFVTHEQPAEPRLPL